MHSWRRRFVSLAFVIIAVTLQGCQDSPTHQVNLIIEDNGVFLLAGEAVTERNLKDQLRVVRTQHKRVELVIRASEKANYERVGRAVVAAQEAGIVFIGFVNSQSSPATPPAPGTATK